MSEAELLKLINNIVRVGTVSSVDAGNRTARVEFTDKGPEPFVSGPLTVLNNAPFIPAQNTAQETQARGGGSGYALFESHTHEVIISPWLPSVGDFVLCLFAPNGGGDGFVIGGI